MLVGFGHIDYTKDNMATNNRQRIINTKFWSDSFVVDKLNPLDRYLFLYFLTNEKTNLSGVYELPIRTIANETGLEKEEVLRMLERLKGKVEYKDGWVCLVNFMKHQNTDNSSILKGIENRLNELPDDVKKWVNSVRKSTSGIPVVDEKVTTGEQLNLTKLNLTKPNTTPSSKVDISKNKNTPKEEKKEIQPWEKEDKIKWKDDLISKGPFGKLLMEYFIIKEMKFPTRSSANTQVKRFVKTARQIVGDYPDEKVVTKALIHLKKNSKPEMWTLETLIKILPTL